MGSATCQIDCSLKVGNMFLGFTDLVTTMPFGQISLGRYYNSNNKTPGDFGYGWSMGLTGMELYESHDLSEGYTQTITGESVTFVYDDAHNLLQIYDPMGNAVARNEYDENGRLLSVTDANGNRLR